MPKEGENILKFINHHKQIRVPYVIYTDFEALNQPVNEIISNFTRQISNQVSCSYHNLVVHSDGVVNAPVMYRGENAVEHFLTAMRAK